MLQNINDVFGHKLIAADGDIGHVQDFYFDDQRWAVRYLVANTGTWLTGRLVLVAPHAFAKLDSAGKTLHLKLSKKQIENSPSIDAHKPVSRQYEEDFYRYYGWPAYWQGGGMWGMEGIPIFTPPPIGDARPHHGHNQREDIHLRSTKAVTGYQIQATDGTLGTVRGFMVSPKSWAIVDLIVEAGHWYAGKEILIAPNKIERISYEDSKVFVSLTLADLQRTAENQVAKSSR